MTIEEFFRKNNCYKVTAEGSINTRCPFCGDSQKPHHLINYGQAYIFKDGYFKCFRCGKYTTAQEAIIKIAQNLKIEPPQEILNQFKITSIKYIMKSTKKYDYYEQTEKTYKDYSFKIKYLKERIGDNISIDFINRFKIILDLDPYHEHINKKFKNIKPNEYVGFLSYDSKRIVLRKITDDIRYRYLSLAIEPTYDFYSSNDLPQLFFDTKTVVIGEGVFDILNKTTRELFTGAYVASLSKTSIISAIRQIFMKFLLKFNVIILKDRDVDINYLRFIKKSVSDFTTSFKVYENLAGKDFGENKIILNKIEI